MVAARHRGLARCDDKAAPPAPQGGSCRRLDVDRQRSGHVDIKNHAVLCIPAGPASGLQQQSVLVWLMAVCRAVLMTRTAAHMSRRTADRRVACMHERVDSVAAVDYAGYPHHRISGRCGPAVVGCRGEVLHFMQDKDNSGWHHIQCQRGAKHAGEVTHYMPAPLPPFNRTCSHSQRHFQAMVYIRAFSTLRRSAFGSAPCACRRRRGPAQR